MSFYIAPNSTIQFFTQIPLDSEYTNTLYFSNRTRQTQYFDNRVRKGFTFQSYQRHSKGKLRVECTPETLYAVNYMRFQNTSFGSKWFYCFIEDVEYINNNCTEVSYTIDVMQTYLFEMKWTSVYVNRMHTRTDEIGDNTIPENLPLGDYVFYDLLKTGSLGGGNKMTDCYIVLATTVEKVPGGEGAYEGVDGYMAGGIYQGCSYVGFNTSDVGEKGFQDLNTYLKWLTDHNKSDAVIDLFMCPKFMFDDSKHAQQGVNSFNISTLKWTNAFTDDIDSYKPRNNKMFTYPYNFLTVTNGNGSSTELHYEYFNSDNCEFTIEGICSGNINIFCIPMKYRGIERNWYEKLTIRDLPKCSYNINAYAQYISGQGQLDRLASISQTINTGATLYTKYNISEKGLDSAEFKASAVTNALNQMAKESVVSSMPPQFKGGNSGNAVFSAGYMDFTFSHTFVRPEFARVIDDYFTRFGYAINRVIVPTINNRSRYTYIKTTGMDVNGDIPHFAVKQINNVFDNGITFWSDTANVGNYAPNNTPLG